MQYLFNNAVNAFIDAVEHLAPTPGSGWPATNRQRHMADRERCLHEMRKALDPNLVSAQFSRPLVLVERSVLRALREAIDEGMQTLDDDLLFSVVLARARDIGRTRSLDVSCTYRRGVVQPP